VKKVLVTGASGFVGRHSLEALLAAGYEVHAVARRPGAPGSAAITWHAVDLLEAAPVQALLSRVAPTHLLHFAWYAEHGAYWQSLENFRWVSATLELLPPTAASVS
jgi:uncharacterized protein YbjT (DUF2867 family)